MTDPTIRLLFTPAELIRLRRCPDCGWDPKTQFHHPDCPAWDESAPDPSTQSDGKRAQIRQGDTT